MRVSGLAALLAATCGLTAAATRAGAVAAIFSGCLAKQKPGSATAAITEQLLCASAATVVMCNRRGACACGRGLDSGFVSAIKFYRARMGLSVRGDAAGGIFSF